MDSQSNNFKTTTADIGELLGRGLTRRVYQHKNHKDLVIKICDYGIPDNKLEYQVWEIVERFEDERAWLAPCLYINEDGTILVQKKATILKDISPQSTPIRVPDYFEDTKPSNWGMIGKRLVCVDYSACIQKFACMALQSKGTKKITNGYFH